MPVGVLQRAAPRLRTSTTAMLSKEESAATVAGLKRSPIVPPAEQIAGPPRSGVADARCGVGTADAATGVPVAMSIVVDQSAVPRT